MLDTLVENYCLPNGYNSNLEPAFCRRSPLSYTFQFYIYRFAYDHYNFYPNYDKVIDVGCGDGDKLVAFFENDTTGIEYAENYELCTKRYPDRKWINANLEVEFPLEKVENALILCIDVIEHLVKPDFLLNTFAELLKYNNTLIISTPDRERIYGKNHLGPPRNTSHVREWTQDELVNLLKHYNIPVQVSMSMPDRIGSESPDTTVLVCY